MLIYNRYLSRGATGSDVRALQSALVKLGYDPKGVDGIFGAGCRAAVIQFQKDNKLVVDGIAGLATVGRINALLIGANAAAKPTPTPQPISKYYTLGDARIIETLANNIRIAILGNTLHGSGAYGVNGSFFDTPRPGLANSAWSIATNNGKALGGNSMLVSYNASIRRGTIVHYKNNTTQVLRVNNINEFPKAHEWSISGYSVYPYMNFREEQMPGGINYRTAHTYIGHKGNRIFLIVKPYHMITEILPLVRQLGLEGCIVLDGGGSSQLRHPAGSYRSGRRINTAVLLKQI